MLEGRVSRRELEAEKGGCASLNNESIDPPADDGSGCYDDRCTVTRSAEKWFVSQNRALKHCEWMILALNGGGGEEAGCD